MEDSEAAFKRHEGVGPKVKQAYEEAIKQIFADLSCADLQAWDAIYQEHEQSALDTESIVDRTRSLMTKVVLEMNRCFFASNDVPNKLQTLEMLKEHFAAYEGKKWNVNTAAPDKLTRPLRMRFLDFSVEFMEQQLASQAKELEIAMAKSNANRERLQHVHDKRLKLTVQMEQQLSQYEKVKTELIKLGEALNDF
uniref:Nnf1a n=1 Tax=Drosophila melanogaster TaxID=7227 RepID=Q7JZC9_DROME|eukprot:NP_611492.1 Nnf1a [Drosophila melanogaster]